MSPRPKSPDSKDKQYRLRMDDAELEMLEYCCQIFNTTKSEIIRRGIRQMYEEAKRMENWNSLEDFNRFVNGKKK